MSHARTDTIATSTTLPFLVRWSDTLIDTFLATMPPMQQTHFRQAWLAFRYSSAHPLQQMRAHLQPAVPAPTPVSTQLQAATPSSPGSKADTQTPPSSTTCMYVYKKGLQMGQTCSTQVRDQSMFCMRHRRQGMLPPPVMSEEPTSSLPQALGEPALELELDLTDAMEDPEEEEEVYLSPLEEDLQGIDDDLLEEQIESELDEIEGDREVDIGDDDDDPGEYEDDE